MRKKNKYINDVIKFYGAGCYFLGISIVSLLNILVSIPWYLNLFLIICCFPTGMVLISKSKKISRDIRDKSKERSRREKKEKKVKNN